MTTIDILEIDEIDFSRAIPSFRMRVKLMIQMNLIVQRFKIKSYEMWYYVRINNPQEWELYFIKATDSMATQRLNQKLSLETINKIKNKYLEQHKKEMLI